MLRALAAVALLAAACGAKPPAEPMPNIVSAGPIQSLQWGAHGAVGLRGPYGQILTLEGDGQRSLQWAPEHRDALELEVRARIVDYGPDPGFPSVAPLVRFRLTYGHGQLTLQDPFLCPFTLQGGIDAYTQTVLPARGTVFRVAARELEISFFQPCKIDSTAAWPQVHVAISVLPVYAPATVVPRQHYTATLPLPAGLPIEPFPPWATEFRCFDDQGRPFAAGTGNMTFFTLGGALIAAPSVGIEQYATFQPIPVQAAAWGPPVPCGVEYR
jgi:hypothetical protein